MGIFSNNPDSNRNPEDSKDKPTTKEDNNSTHQGSDNTNGLKYYTQWYGVWSGVLSGLVKIGALDTKGPDVTRIERIDEKILEFIDQMDSHLGNLPDYEQVAKFIDKVKQLVNNSSEEKFNDLFPDLLDILDVIESTKDSYDKVNEQIGLIYEEGSRIKNEVEEFNRIYDEYERERKEINLDEDRRAVYERLLGDLESLEPLKKNYEQTQRQAEELLSKYNEACDNLLKYINEIHNSFEYVNETIAKIKPDGDLRGTRKKRKRGGAQEDDRKETLGIISTPYKCTLMEKALRLRCDNVTKQKTEKGILLANSDNIGYRYHEIDFEYHGKAYVMLVSNIRNNVTFILSSEDYSRLLQDYKGKSISLQKTRLEEDYKAKRLNWCLHGTVEEINEFVDKLGQNNNFQLNSENAKKEYSFSDFDAIFSEIEYLISEKIVEGLVPKVEDLLKILYSKFDREEMLSSMHGAQEDNSLTEEEAEKLIGKVFDELRKYEQLRDDERNSEKGESFAKGLIEEVDKLEKKFKGKFDLRGDFEALKILAQESFPDLFDSKS